MASEQTIKYIKDAEGNLLKIDYDALANKPIIEQAEFVIGEEGTEDEGILSIEGVQGSNVTDPDGGSVDLSEYSTTSQMTAAINISKNEAIDESKSYTDQAIENIDNSDIINMINMLHYYGNKDIFLIPDGIGMIYDPNTHTQTFAADCNIHSPDLIIPYDLKLVYNDSAPLYDFLAPEKVTKIVIPRCSDVDFYYEEGFADGERLTWSDETFLEHFPNLEIIVRVHEDGAVSSYNLITETLN